MRGILGLKKPILSIVILLMLLSISGLSSLPVYAQSAYLSAAPELSVPTTMSAVAGGTLEVPVTFTANGNDISAVAFWIDYDETYLSIDKTDTNEDGVPNAITYQGPGTHSISTPSLDVDGEGRIGILIADTSLPFASLLDGNVLTITFTVKDQEGKTTVGFANDTAKTPRQETSFSDLDGNDVAGTSSNGDVTITQQTWEATPTSDDPDKSGDPGTSVSYNVTIENTGTEADAFDLSIDGGWGANVDPATVTLESGATADVTVKVTVAATALVGESNKNTLTVTPQGDTSNTKSLELMTIANAIYGVEVVPETASLNEDYGKTVTYSLTVKNTGNTTDDFLAEFSGNNWTTTLSQGTFTLDAGQQQEIQVSVTVPSEEAAIATSDEVVVSIASQTEATAKDTSVLTTRLSYGIELEAAETSLAGNPGTIVTYTLSLTNSGGIDDSYTLVTEGNSWTTTVTPTESVTITGKANKLIMVAVQIPVSATAGLQDQVGIHATSKGDASGNTTSVITLTTKASRVYGVNLAAVGTDAKSGKSGEVVHYTLQMTNTGNFSNTFNVNSMGNKWESSLEVAKYPGDVYMYMPGTFFTLGIQESVDLTVTVKITNSLASVLEDTVMVKVTSLGSKESPSSTASLTLTTTLLDYGVILTPVNMEKDGQPGTSVTYTLMLENTSNQTDTFDLVLNNQQWTTKFQTSTQPTVTLTADAEITLEGNGSMSLTVVVDIPSNPTSSISDTVLLQAISQGDRTQIATSTLQTSISQVWSDIVQFDAISRTASLGSSAIYRLIITNTGNEPFSFIIRWSGNTWTTEVRRVMDAMLSGVGLVQSNEIRIEELPSGEQAQLDIGVEVPAGANPGDSDTVTVVITIEKTGQNAQYNLITTATEVSIYLPLVNK
jgi:uncharacterized membrane protein